ncbi:uncharacterized protein LOC123870917 isoform X2 [Maniola jurtina]|uniref:uncharacterized protein LOC123870917 isoform X2 n=1 Tax=Maniola jurtina TaxID=191418 RepID=UPI001E68E40F|nr:uncharacterized protein LOC123870917 isoform X2 [Maniola jurtina]
MFLFNLNSYHIIWFLNVFVQESSENKNIKCVSFYRYATLTVTIILKDVPKNLKSPELEHPNLGNTENHLSISYYETYFEFDPMDFTDPPDQSLLNVNFNNYDGYTRVKIPLVQFILEKNDSVPVDNYNCSSSCKLEFDVSAYQSDPGYLKWVAANYPRHERYGESSRKVLHGPQIIKILEGKEVATIEVVLKNIPSDTHSVQLFYKSTNVSPTGIKVVKNHSETHFNKKIKFTLVHSYKNHNTVLIRLINEKNVTVSEDTELVDFIRYTKKEKQKADVCFDECIIVYNFNQDYGRNESNINSGFTFPVPSNVCTAQINRIPHYESKPAYISTTTPTLLSTTTSKTIEGRMGITNELTNTKSTEETTIKSTTGTTTKAIEEISTKITEVTTTKTTERITMVTDKASPNNLAISLTSIAAVLVILVTVGTVLYRRYKVATPVNDDTYLYATQLNYAQLQLESSELYEAPQRDYDYLSSYTRVIGVLKPILAEKKERNT